jgi:cytochrome c2
MIGRHMVGNAFRAGACLGLILMFPVAWSASADGQALFEKRCAACHQLPDIDNPPPEGWEQKLKQMAPLAKLKGQQEDAVLAYLSSHVQETTMSASLEADKAFFERKCSRCHTLDRIFLEPLTDESRQHVVSRMQVRSGTDWLSDEDVERVLNYLSSATREAPTPPALAADAGAEQIFAARCQTCHTMERVAVHLGPGSEMEMDWSHVVNRMRGKAPQWITDAESRKIVDYLESF